MNVNTAPGQVLATACGCRCGRHDRERDRVETDGDGRAAKEQTLDRMSDRLAELERDAFGTPLEPDEWSQLDPAAKRARIEARIEDLEDADAWQVNARTDGGTDVPTTVNFDRGDPAHGTFDPTESVNGGRPPDGRRRANYVGRGSGVAHGADGDEVPGTIDSDATEG